MYNGSFYYNPENRSSIYRLDLGSAQTTHNKPQYHMELILPGLRINDNNYLYSRDHDSSYVDFDVDENGEWVYLSTHQCTPYLQMGTPKHLELN